MVGSEFLGSAVVPGSTRWGLRHEDLQALSFSDAAFDFVLSFKVLEHVPDAPTAFREIFRVLRPGGTCLLTAPVDLSSDHEITRARLVDGVVHHLWEPEYLGNPVDVVGGALCYRYFGWSLLEEMRAMGFADPTFVCWWSPMQGYLGFPQVAIVATKR